MFGWDGLTLGRCNLVLGRGASKVWRVGRGVVTSGLGNRASGFCVPELSRDHTSIGRGASTDCRVSRVVAMLELSGHELDLCDLMSRGRGTSTECRVGRDVTMSWCDHELSRRDHALIGRGASPACRVGRDVDGDGHRFVRGVTGISRSSERKILHDFKIHIIHSSNPVDSRPSSTIQTYRTHKLIAIQS